MEWSNMTDYEKKIHNPGKYMEEQLMKRFDSVARQKEREKILMDVVYKQQMVSYYNNHPELEDIYGLQKR